LRKERHCTRHIETLRAFDAIPARHGSDRPGIRFVVQPPRHAPHVSRDTTHEYPRAGIDGLEHLDEYPVVEAAVFPADLASFRDEHCGEVTVSSQDLGDHLQVAVLEHSQLQRISGQHASTERKDRKFTFIHARDPLSRRQLFGTRR
jgi:hypothetical protein